MSRFRYLNGIDWVVTGLDHSLRQIAGVGNWSQLVLELDGVPDSERLAEAARKYASQFAVLQGKAVRGWQLVPVWKMPRRLKPVTVPVETEHLGDDVFFEKVVERLGQNVTAPPGTPGNYIAFKVLRAGQKTFLAFRFDHRLLDARGAELFLQGLITRMEEGETSDDKPFEPPEQKPCLSPWIPKFKSGQHIVRLMRSRCREAAPFEMPLCQKHGSEFHFSVISLSLKQSEALSERAYTEAGYLMLTPWLAALVSKEIESLMQDSGRPLGGCMIPCSADLRSDSNFAMFFNHVGFICLSRPFGEPPKDGWARHFSRQFMEQVKNEIPHHFENAWKLSRILPAPLYGRLLRTALKSFGGTISMGSVGEGLSSIQSVAGVPVNNAFHMPVVPPAPGLGFFVNSFNNRFNFCLSSYGGILTATEHNQLTDRLKNKLALSN